MKRFCFTLCIAITCSTYRAFGAEKGMPQLDTEYWGAQIFWLILIFSALYITIWKIFLPKIVQSIENRKSRIVNDINETQKLKERAEKKLVEYNKIIEEAKKEAKKIINDNKRKLERDIKDKNDKFNQEIEKELLAAEKEIKNLMRSSILNINKISTEVSSELIKEIVGSKVNASNVSAIVEEISKRKIEKNI